jgi:hypothetical protein
MKAACAAGRPRPAVSDSDDNDTEGAPIDDDDKDDDDDDDERARCRRQPSTRADGNGGGGWRMFERPSSLSLLSPPSSSRRRRNTVSRSTSKSWSARCMRSTTTLLLRMSNFAWRQISGVNASQPWRASTRHTNEMASGALPVAFGREGVLFVVTARETRMCGVCLTSALCTVKLEELVQTTTTNVLKGARAATYPIELLCVDCCL